MLLILRSDLFVTLNKLFFGSLTIWLCLQHHLNFIYTLYEAPFCTPSSFLFITCYKVLLLASCHIMTLWSSHSMAEQRWTHCQVIRSQHIISHLPDASALLSFSSVGNCFCSFLFDQDASACRVKSRVMPSKSNEFPSMDEKWACSSCVHHGKKVSPSVYVQ